MPPLLSESPRILPIHRKILGFSFIGWIFDFYDLLLLSFLIASTSLTKDLGLTGYDVSVLLGTALAFTAVGGLVGGALADRYGRKPLLMITILIYSVGTFLCGLATDMWTLLIARAITGFGVGGEWAVAHALVGETVPPAVRGRYGSYLQSGAAFARFFATVVGNFLAPWIGWRLSFMLSALPALIVVFIRRQMPESDVWLAQSPESRTASRLRVLGEMVGPALRKTTAIATAVTTCNMAAYWFKTIWLPTYFHQVRGLSLEASATLLFMDQLGSLAGYLGVAWIIDTIGRRPTFMAFSMVKALGLLVITLGWDMVEGSSITLYGAMILIGVGEGNWGCIGPLLNEVFPTRLRAAALGIIYNLSRGVQFLAPIVITWVAARSSFGAGIALAAPFAVLAGSIVWALPETKGVRLAGSAERAAVS